LRVVVAVPQGRRWDFGVQTRVAIKRCGHADDNGGWTNILGFDAA
jgi:hypothetical protein